MRKIALFLALVSILLAATYKLMSSRRSYEPTMTSTAFAQEERSPEIASRAAVINGKQVGEVLIDGQVVFRIRTAAGGNSPAKRAEIVAERLKNLAAKPIKPEDITTGRLNGQDVVLANSEVIITADQPHAKINQTTPFLLAHQWESNLKSALFTEEAVESQVGISQKVVPIISVGSGTRVGGALVTGTRNYLDNVTAVAQVEGTFANAIRVKILVPVSSENVFQNISRVPQTSITGLVDIKL